ncbi:Ger(x)C family spore germination protein [Paenibacillus kobensis]|uniref:Ger(x)C family spore germination protein n=1 Tax=Paenibacillus kobensis TaxID=59841 RepID=UPI0013E3A869|nr:Ger(x)C family spore germination protein [Paenibacillus kobensis]
MRKWFKILFLILSIALLSGCWNREELPEKAFVMGIAINKPEPDKVKIMVQLFKPSQKTAGKGDTGNSFTNIESTGATTQEAIRDITLRLGRKTQWGHTRMIIIDERTAARNNLLSLLELFYRDHETRITTKVVIAKEDSADLLKEKPMIELTSSQQMNRMEEIANRFAGKVPNMTLLKLARDLKSETGNTIMPLMSKSSSNEMILIGSAAIHQGQFAGPLSSRQTQDLLMLRGQFRSGIVKVPCEANNNEKERKYESLEVQSVNSVMKPAIASDSLRVHYQVKVQGNISELQCTRLDTSSDETAYLHRIEELIQKRLLDTIKYTQSKEVDLLGIGNSIYRKHTRIWRQWKPDWDKRYAEAKFDIKVTVHIDNTLTMVGKPLFTK